MQESKCKLHKTHRPTQHRLYTKINMYDVFYTYFTCNLNEIKLNFLLNRRYHATLVNLKSSGRHLCRINNHGYICNSVPTIKIMGMLIFSYTITQHPEIKTHGTEINRLDRNDFLYYFLSV